MIPHVLHIKNFLSYGPETQIIDFRPYNLISLSGKNGHGKSALLDAITWAIWGQARKSSGQSKPDAGLMHLGQKHMMVILEFEVNGNIYRVRREYLQAQAKPFATLDFGIQNEEGKIVALTDKTIKDTQDKIERTIGITYDSFANSTFLRQGQSNEFSKKSPKERKEILAQILQLQRFEQQKKIALAHARKLQIEYQAKTQIQHRITEELTQLSTVADQYLRVQEQLQIIELQLTAVTDQIKAIHHQEQQAAAQLNEVTFLQKQYQELQNRESLLNKEIKQLQTQLHQLNPELSKESLLAREQKTIEKLQLFEKNQSEKNQLKELYLTTKEQIAALTQKIQQQYQQQHQTTTALLAQQEEALKQIRKQKIQEQTTIINLEQQIKSSQAQTDQFLSIISAYDQIKIDYENYKNSYEQQRQEYQQVCAQGTYIKQYAQKIENDQTTLTTGANQPCLLCTQPLSPELRSLVHNKLNHQQIDLQEQLLTLKKNAHDLKISIAQNLTMVNQYQQQYEQGLQAQAKYDQNLQSHQKLELQLAVQIQKKGTLEQEEALLIAAIQNTQKTIQEILRVYEEGISTPEIKERTSLLQEIELKGRSLSVSPEDYQATQRELSEIRELLAQFKQQDKQVEQQVRMNQLSLQAHDIHQQLVSITQQLATYSNLEKRIQELKNQELSQLSSEKQLKNELQQALILKGSLEQKQKKQLDLEQELTNIVLQTKSIHQELVDYQEIAKALGKDGIQALLIEQAIPEIEHETNQILARLTNNQTQIFIESLRDLKKGGSKETLDIKIADPFGLRDYEMFSGGEAFRIDFALRIGISKLLARRAGTTLQTIFIDEGFGSQDDEGLGLIMDNIHKIQEDFAKIIIVSHLQELKEQFPVQFIVEKKRSGSSVSIVHQG